MTSPAEVRSPLAERVLTLLEHETRVMFPLPARYSIHHLCRDLNVDDTAAVRAAVDELHAGGLVTDDVALTLPRHVELLMAEPDLDALIANSRYLAQMAPSAMLEIAGQYVAWDPDSAAAVDPARAVTLLTIALTRAGLHDRDLRAQLDTWEAAGTLPGVARLLGSMVARGQVRPPRSVPEVATLVAGVLTSGADV